MVVVSVAEYRVVPQDATRPRMRKMLSMRYRRHPVVVAWLSALAASGGAAGFRFPSAASTGSPVR